MTDSPGFVHVLEPKFLFGMTAGMAGSCLFVDDDRIMYNAAGVLIVHNIATNTQHFVHLKEPQRRVTTIALNNGKYVPRPTSPILVPNTYTVLG